MINQGVLRSMRTSPTEEKMTSQNCEEDLSNVTAAPEYRTFSEVMPMIDKWVEREKSSDTTIWIPDSSLAVSHRKFIRKWNQLSRLQRSLIYAMILITITFIGLLYWDRVLYANATKSSIRVKTEYESVNDSLVIELTESSSKKVKAQPVGNESEDRPIFTGPTNRRQTAVVESFKHAWKAYKDYAWGHDNLKPLSKASSDWFSLGLTLVDGLDTAFIMGLTDEFEEGRDWVAKELTFTRNKDVNFFEVTIRVLGALLTNYHFTQDKMFLQKAEDLGERLMGAFASPSGVPFSDVNLATRRAHAPDWSPYSSTAEVTTVQLEFRELSRATGDPKYEEDLGERLMGAFASPSGVPFSDVNLATRRAHAPDWSPYSSTAEVTTVQLEFRELSRATGDPKYEDAAAQVSEKISKLPKKHGLVPIFISPHTGRFLPHATITLGARGDSYYEYLLKQWLQTGKTINYLKDDYLTAIEGVREFLAKRTSPNKLLFIGELASGSGAFNPKMDHLTCFLPGTLALGHSQGLPDWHLRMAEELLYTCYLTYAVQPTFLAPEITHFNLANPTDDMYTKTADAHSLLRPEFVESLWYMYQITGNTTFQDWGWQIFEAYQKYARTECGFASLDNVRLERPQQRDMMESFFLSETLKYLYLLFSDDRRAIDLDKFVINSEAHPLPIRDH